MSIPVRRRANPLFGQPTLASANNGWAGWIRGSVSPLDQKGSTGWLAELYGGVQTGDDWARVNIPVDEIFVTDFNRALWSWYQTAAESMGLGIVIWIHDPNDFDNRAEVTQLGGHADLPKALGWNAFSFSSATGGMFYYGEGTTGTGLTAGTQYTWAQFQADVIFRNWSIYRITFDWGWEASGTFESAYVADVKLNGVAVPLTSGFGERAGGETKTLYIATSGTSTTKATALSPATGKRLVVHQISMTSASATAANFEVYFGTGTNITTDATKAITIANLDTDSRPSEYPYFGNGDKGCPKGLADEVVSIRTSVDISTNGYFVFVYHEE